MNKVFLIGHVGQDPEIKTLPNGTKLAKCSIATNEKWTDKQGEKQEKTTWHNLVFWDKKAELCEKYITKGKQIFIEGTLDISEHEGKRYTQVIVKEIILL